jgi:hypothetical protein
MVPIVIGIPEPATSILMGSGLLAFGYMYMLRRKRR